MVNTSTFTLPYTFQIESPNAITNGNEITLITSQTQTHERYSVVEYSDVLFYDIPYCPVPSPPPFTNLQTFFIFYESEADLTDCNYR